MKNHKKSKPGTIEVGKPSPLLRRSQDRRLPSRATTSSRRSGRTDEQRSGRDCEEPQHVHVCRSTASNGGLYKGCEDWRDFGAWTFSSARSFSYLHFPWDFASEIHQDVPVVSPFPAKAALTESPVRLAPECSEVADLPLSQNAPKFGQPDRFFQRFPDLQFHLPTEK